MLRPQTKLRFANDANDMRVKVRREFENTCIATGSQHRQGLFTVCTAHVLPASTFPSVKACLENGLPFSAVLHNYQILANLTIAFTDGRRISHTQVGCLDKTATGSDRRPLDRLKWLSDYLPDDGWAIAHSRLKMLFEEGAILDKQILTMKDDALVVLSCRDEALDILGGAE